MADIKLGLNTEAFRHADKSLEYSLEATRRLGYRYVELNVQTGRDLFSEAGYSAQISMERDPLEIKEKLDALGLKVSGLSAHSPMAQPEVSIPFLTQAIRFADELGAPCVNTDEGVVPEWMGDAEAFAMMRYTLKRVLPVAERHKVHIALEPHQKFTVRLATYKKILDLVKSPYFNCVHRRDSQARRPRPRQGHRWRDPRRPRQVDRGAERLRLWRRRDRLAQGSQDSQEGRLQGGSGRRVWHRGTGRREHQVPPQGPPPGLIPLDAPKERRSLRHGTAVPVRAGGGPGQPPGKRQRTALTPGICCNLASNSCPTSRRRNFTFRLTSRVPRSASSS